MTDKPDFNFKIQPDLAVIVTANPEGLSGDERIIKIRAWPKDLMRTYDFEAAVGETEGQSFRAQYQRLQILEDYKHLLVQVSNINPLIDLNTRVKFLIETRMEHQRSSLTKDKDYTLRPVERTIGLEFQVAEENQIEEFVPIYRVYPIEKQAVKVETILWIPRESDFAPKIADALILMNPHHYDSNVIGERPVRKDEEGNLRIALSHLGNIAEKIRTYSVRTKDHFAELREAAKQDKEQYNDALKQYLGNLHEK